MVSKLPKCTIPRVNPHGNQGLGIIMMFSRGPLIVTSVGGVLSVIGEGGQCLCGVWAYIEYLCTFLSILL